MSEPGLVSTVIPTYNRKEDVSIAVKSALAQTYPAHEILVVDDGSSDGTADLLRQEFGDRIRVLSKPNGGVSSARNHGMAAARGEYLALLDSDDEWLPEKVAAQVAFLQKHRDFGMVLTDVALMDEQRRDYGVVHRRKFIPEDGRVLRWVLRQPALAPSSALLRRQVYEDIGGFDTSLKTAEDLDFHLRVALRHKIGVVEMPLTRYMRNGDGLGALARTYRDYMMVIERFLRDNPDEVSEEDRRAALLNAYARGARGLLFRGDYREALRFTALGASQVRDLAGMRQLGELAAVFFRNVAARARRTMLGGPAGPR